MLSSVTDNAHSLPAQPAPVDFGLTIKRAQHLLALQIDDSLRPIGLNLGLWAALREAARMPGASASELARASFQTPQTLGGLLQRLERRGLIERALGRGRIVENRLTPAGQDALRQATATVEAVITAALADFDSPDRAAFHRLATRFVTALAGTHTPAPDSNASADRPPCG